MSVCLKRMTGVYKAEDAKSRWRSWFDSAIIRLVLLAGAIRSVQLGWIALIAHVFDTEVRGLFSKPIFALLPWILWAIPSAFLVYSVGVRLMERRKVDVPSNFDSRLSVFPLPTAVLRTVSFSGRVYKLTASFSRRVRLADRPLKPLLALSIVYFHNLR